MSQLPPEAYRIFAKAAGGALTGTPDLKTHQVIAAVSGGLDSMVLLRFLMWLRQKVSFDLIVAHLDHGLREEADADATLVASYAASFDLPFHLQKEDVAARAGREGEGLEAAGRRARYEFFSTLSEAGEKPSYIALAHHRDDQAETVLLHLTRGSGLKGLAGMRELDGDRWRPFLQLSRAELEMVADVLQIPYAVDRTNETRDFLRNRLRLDLLPRWSELAGHDMTKKLADLATLADLDDQALDQVAAEVRQETATGRYQLSVAALITYPDAIIRRVLDLVFGEVTDGGRLSKRHIVSLLEALKASEMRQIDLPSGVRAKISYGQLSFVTG
ncbi:MAG TPA: tRNA lysidine(34) synthetase TilS [Fastidiosipila sp.]|nr:tRNA lysidine(34) synthetase TilS [Fastidiosipila sp.]